METSDIWGKNELFPYRYLEVHSDMPDLEPDQAGQNCHQGTTNGKKKKDINSK
jgi:hypothetical protein